MLQKLYPYFQIVLCIDYTLRKKSKKVFKYLKSVLKRLPPSTSIDGLYKVYGYSYE